MKAIETTYSGVRFRSRLEARWAVFFDALGIKWEYEPEAFKLSDGTCYLPDFRLSYPSPHVGGAWLEVKPEGRLSAPDLRKIQGFTESLGGRDYPLLVCGPPWSCELFCCEANGPSGLLGPEWYFACRFAPSRPPPAPFLQTEEEASNAVATARAHRFWDPAA